MSHSAVRLFMQEPHQQHVLSLLGVLVRIADVLSAVGHLLVQPREHSWSPQRVNLLVLPRRNLKEFIQRVTLSAFSLAILLAGDPSLPGPSYTQTEQVPLIRFDLNVPGDVLESISGTLEEWDLLPGLAKSSQ